MTVTARRVSRLVLALTTCAAFGTLSAGTVANGTVPFNFTNVTANANTLTPTTQFTIGTVSVSGNGTGSFTCTPSPAADSVCSGYGAGLSVDPFTGNALSGEILSFDGGIINGTSQYDYQVTSQDAPSITTIGTQTFYNIDTNGIFSDLRGAGGFSSAPASLSITFTENCTGNNCSVSGGASFATPPAFLTAPEPFTLSLFGAGLVAIGMIRRRKV